MKFVVCYPWEKRRNYRWTEIIIALLAIIIGMNFGPSIVRAVKAGNMAVIIALSAIVVIFLFVGLISLWTNKFLITVNEKERTIEIKRFLRLTKRFNILDVESWMVKINRKGRTLYLKFTGGSVKVKSDMDNWETLRKFLNDNASDRLDGDEGREATEYSFMSETEKLEEYVDGVVFKIMDTTSILAPDDKCVDPLVFKNDYSTLLEGFKVALKDQWLGEGFEEEKKIIDTIKMDVISGCNSLDEFFDIIPKKPDLSDDELLEKKTAFKKYLTEEFGQPMAFYNAAKPLDESISKAIGDSTKYDDILDIHFVEFAEYTVGIVVGNDEL